MSTFALRMLSKLSHNSKYDVTRARLASVGILRREREPQEGKLGWYGNLDKGFEMNTLSYLTLLLFRSKSRVRGFFDLFLKIRKKLI